MAFEKIEKTQRGVTRSPEYVGMSCRKYGPANSTRFAAIVMIAAGVMDKMSWQYRSLINAERGRDEDNGVLRLSTDGLSGFSLRRSGSTATGYILTISALAAPEKHRPTPVEYEIKDGALYITLPEWARG